MIASTKESTQTEGYVIDYNQTCLRTISISAYPCCVRVCLDETTHFVEKISDESVERPQPGEIVLFIDRKLIASRKRYANREFYMRINSIIDTVKNVFT